MTPSEELARLKATAPGEAEASPEHDDWWWAGAWLFYAERLEAFAAAAVEENERLRWGHNRIRQMGADLLALDPPASPDICHLARALCECATLALVSSTGQRDGHRYETQEVTREDIERGVDHVLHRLTCAPPPRRPTVAGS